MSLENTTRLNCTVFIFFFLINEIIFFHRHLLIEYNNNNLHSNSNIHHILFQKNFSFNKNITDAGIINCTSKSINKQHVWSCCIWTNICTKTVQWILPGYNCSNSVFHDVPYFIDVIYLNEDVRWQKIRIIKKMLWNTEWKSSRINSYYWDLFQYK